MKPKVLIVGSSNTDMVIKADHLPTPGETILGGAQSSASYRKEVESFVPKSPGATT